MKSLLIFAGLLLCQVAQAQYISRSEPVPFNCPSVCPGSTIVLKIPQVQNLPNGALVQALLSDPTGSFASGTTVLNSTRYSTNAGTSWTPGPYAFTANINDLYFEITIPNNQPVGTNYTIKIQSSSGYVSNDLFSCSGSNYITVSAAYTTLPAVANNAQGINQWLAHVYTWTPTTNQMLTTAALVSAQDFFNPANYQGHFVKDSLGFDINYTPHGGVCPGPIGVLHDGTSIPCSQGFQTNFSIQMLRKQTFAPGLYKLELWGDDGIRLSVDGGSTWILSSYFEQVYANSYVNTDGQYPNGVCLSGPTDMVIDYFQRPADARLTLKVTLLSPTIVNPANVTVCAGQNATFSTTVVSGATYQWEYSTNGGSTFTSVPNSAPYSGATSNVLSVTGVPGSYNGYLYHCVISGVCGNAVNTSNATLVVSGSSSIALQPVDTGACGGGAVSFHVGVNDTTATYQWQVNTGSGFSNVTNTGVYSGATTATLNLSATNVSMNGYQYQCIITGCGGTPLTSNVATLTIGSGATITVQPSNDTICEGSNAIFSTTANGTSYSWELDTGSGFQTVAASSTYQNPTTAQLTVVGATAGMNGNKFRCRIHSCNGDTLTQVVVLVITPQPNITSQPMDVHLCHDSSAQFFVVANGSIIGYQWQLNTGSGFSNITNGGSYSGATSPTLNVSTATAAMTGYQYQCVITGCGPKPVISNIATLTIGGAAAINMQPANVAVCEGANAVFSVNASNIISYKWQIDQGSGFQPITANSTYLTPNSPQLTISSCTAAMNGNRVKCTMITCSGNLVSEIATLSVEANASFTVQPKDVIACHDTTVTFQVAAGGNNPSYQWQLSTDNGSTFTNLVNDSTNQNVNTAILTVKDVTEPMDGYVYRCLLGTCAGSVNSAPAKITYCQEAYHLYIPNAFSPNGDGHNDVFMIYGNGFKTIDFKVFDRWGEMVFQTNDHTQGWDGKFSGQILPPDVYVYMVNVVFLNGTTKLAKGSVMLMR